MTFFWLNACWMLVACEQQASEGNTLTPAPVDMVLMDYMGNGHKLADHRGKWVVVNYWATWCAPCLEEIPELEAFYQAYKESDAVVWGITTEQISITELDEFVRRQHIGYPIFRLEPESPFSLGPIPGIPTTYLISPKGEISARKVGMVTKASIEKAIGAQL